VAPYIAGHLIFILDPKVYDGIIGKKKPKPYDIPTEIRRLARERVGAVPSPKLIMPKKQRKKPKHKEPLDQSEDL
jgi:hypothetical protein